MTWTKLSDDFPDDCWTLSDIAFRLHVEAMCWSNRKLLDCHIPHEDLRRFAKHGGGGVDELLAVGWWTDLGSTYRINHHATYQRTKAEVVKQQEANAANGRKGGRPRKTREIVENPSENPVGLQVENPQGQDRTGRDVVKEGSQSSLSNEDEETWNEYVEYERRNAGHDDAA